MSTCRCNELHRLHGREGQDYSRVHLEEIVIDAANWKVLHRCPETGRYWKEFSRHPEAQGGGPPDFLQITEELAREEFRLPAAGEEHGG